ALILLVSASVVAQPPSPKSLLGFHPTEEKTIADWKQITSYFLKLDAASNRVSVREIGKSTLGRPLIAAFISSANNIRNLEKYRRISQQLADARLIRDETVVSNLVTNGKTIVSISCSIHSTEIVASQMSMNLAYELATANDAETKEILDNTILLLIPSPNPDGIDIVANWYRKTLGTKSEGTSPPELYHHYAGHDNNRDWFMLNLAETRAVTKLFWQEWFPQIVYDVHQQGQNGTRFTIPPFYDPPNPRIAPSILRDVGLLGYAMAADLAAENIKGVATNATYDTWWHGGFRSAPYFHNSIGILSEAAGANGGVWQPAHIAQMEMIASRSVLQMAAKYRQRFLRNFYELGKANLIAQKDEPTAFIMTAGQPQAEIIARFLEILMWQGIEVHQLTKELYLRMEPKADYHEMPLGSFLIFVNQPQKNNILSLFERQVYPSRLLPNGEAEAPYDIAGWTLPLQMGIEYDPIWEIRDAEKEMATLKRVVNIDQARAVMNLNAVAHSFPKLPNPLKSRPRIGLYKPFTSSMDEGWTRFVLDLHQIPFKSISNAELLQNKLDCDVVILAADRESTILSGLSEERYPAELAGGIGETGVENLKKFVDAGGKLICFDDSCELVIKRFGLPIKNVLSGLKRNEFFNPGSIVKLAVDTRSPLARGMREELPAYFINSSAFEIAQDARVRVIARYARENTLMSGWMLGEKFLNGKPTLAETDYGKGKIVLFAFRPQHRGQTFATFPFIFNALEKD
ncbi:MAG: M14 family metallopeptidase, partial [Acidobacteria bacterium]|nr:M14 family metallopeptidase [Acidobacteriota bacterium]